MDHADAVTLFSAYHDGDLEPDRARAVADHLAGCDACRDEYQAFERAVGALRGLQRSAPDDFDQHVRQQIHRRSRGRFFGPTSLAGRFPWEAVSLVTLLAVLLLYFFLAVGQPTRVGEGGTGAPPAAGR